VLLASASRSLFVNPSMVTVCCSVRYVSSPLGNQRGPHDLTPGMTSVNVNTGPRENESPWSTLSLTVSDPCKNKLIPISFWVTNYLSLVLL
jgi:hypothetical protein